MGRSLKEALLDQFALLQERGLAPSEMPQEEEAPLVVVESASRGRTNRSRRESAEAYTEREELELSEFDRDRRRGIRREHRGEEARGDRKRPMRGGRGRGRPLEGEAPEFVGPAPLGGERPVGPPMRRPAPLPGMAAGPRREFQGPGRGAPRPGPVGPRPAPSRTAMLQRRAEERRRDEASIAEMRELLAQHSGEEIDDAVMERFSRQMTDEVGALPPPHVVVEAIKEAQSADPRKIADAVRAYYRRRRPRPQPAAPAPPREAALAG